MDTEDEVDEEEMEREQQELMQEDLDEEITAEETPPPNVEVNWGPWAEVAGDKRAHDGVQDRDYGLPNATFDQATSPLDVFRYFLPPTMVDNIIRATNQTGARKHGGN